MALETLGVLATDSILLVDITSEQVLELCLRMRDGLGVTDEAVDARAWQPVFEVPEGPFENGDQPACAGVLGGRFLGHCTAEIISNDEFDAITAEISLVLAQCRAFRVSQYLLKGRSIERICGYANWYPTYKFRFQACRDKVRRRCLA